jgi:glutamyl-tRNA reductase
VIVVGLSHRTAPVEIRERVAVGGDRLEATLSEIVALPGVSEALLLSTCNRMEIYAAGRSPDDDDEVARAVTTFAAELGGREIVPHLVTGRGGDAVRHLFRVAASLDSLVIGEPQILGQLKEAIRAAEKARTIGTELSLALRAAVQVAKKVRSETTIGAGQVSVPSVAVDLARQIFDELHGHTALLVGAGEMAESAARLLARAGTRVLVVNRSPERAAELATQVGGTPATWSSLQTCLVEADIVVSSTASPVPVVTKDMLKGIRRQRRGRSLFLIDIAVPRDIDPAASKLDFVYLYDIDDLSNVVAQSLEGRQQEADRAESVVRREVRLFEERRSHQAMKPVIVALRERTRTLLAAELDRSLRGKLKHLTDDDRRALEMMAEAAINKMLHAPTRNLKQLSASPRAGEIAELLCQLFELETDADEELVDSDADGREGHRPLARANDSA